MKRNQVQPENIIKKKIICEQMPKNIDFGSCPILKKTTKTFLLKNFDTKIYRFSFSKCAFEIEPSEGQIGPDQVLQIQVSCFETNAKIIIAKTVFKAAGRISVIKLSAIFKYPHIFVKKPLVDFQDILIGTEKKMTVEMHNPTDIPVDFQILKSPSDKFNDSSVICETPSGTIQPNDVFNAIFKYTPFIAELKTMSTFELSWMKDMKKEIEVIGTAQRFYGKLSSNVFNFGFVKTDSKSKLECTLFNCVSQEIEFEVKASNSVFQFHKSHGKLPGLSYVRLICQFSPTEEGLYYQRGYIFIKNQDLICIDIIGLSYKTLVFVDDFMSKIPSKSIAKSLKTGGMKQLLAIPSMKDLSIKKSNENYNLPNKPNSPIDIDIYNTTNISSKHPKGNLPPMQFPSKTYNSFKNVTNYKQMLELTSDPSNKPTVGSTNIEVVHKRESMVNLERLLPPKDSNASQVLSFNNFAELFSNKVYKDNLFSISLKNDEILNFGCCLKESVLKTVWIKNLSENINLTFLFFSKNKHFKMDRNVLKVNSLQEQSISIELSTQSMNQLYFEEICVSVYSDITRDINPKKRLDFENDGVISDRHVHENNDRNMTKYPSVYKLNNVKNSIDNFNDNLYKKAINSKDDIKDNIKVIIQSKNENNENLDVHADRFKDAFKDGNTEGLKDKKKEGIEELLKESHNDGFKNKKKAGIIDGLKTEKKKINKYDKFDDINNHKPDESLMKKTGDKINSQKDFLIPQGFKIPKMSDRQIKISDGKSKANESNRNNMLVKNAKHLISSRALFEETIDKTARNTVYTRVSLSQFKKTNLNNNQQRTSQQMNKNIIIETNQSPLDSLHKLFSLHFVKFTVFGHSFEDTLKCVQPIIQFTPDLIVFFQPTFPGDCSYQSLKIENKGDTNCFVKVINKSLKVFSCTPSFVLLSPKQSKSVFLRFCSKREGDFEETLTFQVNFNSHYNLKLKAHCLVSSLEIENNGELYLPPNNYGVETHSTLLFKNTGRNPMNVSIKMSQSDSEFLQISPSNFVIAEKSTELIDFAFTPSSAKIYNIPCHVTAAYRDELLCNKNVFICGKGDDGRIIIRPSDIDFGTVMVNHKNVKKLQIHNIADCNFYVHLQLEFEKIEQTDQNSEHQKYFSLDFNEGIIGCKITKTVNLTFYPREICAFKLKLNLFVSPNVDKYLNRNSCSDDFSKAKLEFHKNHQKGMHSGPKESLDNSDEDDRLNPNDRKKTANNKTSKRSTRLLHKNSLLKDDDNQHQNSSRDNLKLTSTVHQPDEISIASNCSNVKINQNQSKINPVLKDYCKISARAKYPHLKITNVQSNEMSVVYIWDKFQITEINREFSKNLSNFELKYSKKLGLLFDQSLDPDCINRCFSFDFGYVYNKSDQGPRIVRISIQNSGGTELKWKFQEKENKDELNYSDQEDDDLTNNKKTILFDNEKVKRKPSNFVFRPR